MPGSSESGAVPSTSVMVPPDFAVELAPELEDDDDELDELPHALSATTETSERKTVHTVFLCLLTTPPPPRLTVPAGM